MAKLYKQRWLLMTDEVKIMRARRDNPDLPKEFVKQAIEGESLELSPYFKRRWPNLLSAIKSKGVTNGHTIT